MEKKFGGRTPGAIGKITAEVRQSLKLIFDNEIEHLQSNLNGLSSKDRIDVLIKLMPFLIPKMPTEVVMNEQLPLRFQFENDNIGILDEYSEVGLVK